MAQLLLQLENHQGGEGGRQGQRQGQGQGQRRHQPQEEVSVVDDGFPPKTRTKRRTRLRIRTSNKNKNNNNSTSACACACAYAFLVTMMNKMMIMTIVLFMVFTVFNNNHSLYMTQALTTITTTTRRPSPIITARTMMNRHDIDAPLEEHYHQGADNEYEDVTARQTVAASSSSSTTTATWKRIRNHPTKLHHAAGGCGDSLLSSSHNNNNNNANDRRSFVKQMISTSAVTTTGILLSSSSPFSVTNNPSNLIASAAAATITIPTSAGTSSTVSTTNNNNNSRGSSTPTTTTTTMNRRVGGLAQKIRSDVCVTMDELQRDLMQERWDLLVDYPTQLRSYVPIFTTYTDSAFSTDVPSDYGLRVALRYEVGRFFASVERLKRAINRNVLDEAYTAYADMSLHLDRYLRVGGLYTYYDNTIDNEPYFRDYNDALVYADPMKDPAYVRDLVVLCKGPDKGRTGIVIGIYPTDGTFRSGTASGSGSNNKLKFGNGGAGGGAAWSSSTSSNNSGSSDGVSNYVVKLDRYRGMREIRVVPKAWAAKRLGEQEPDDVFLLPRSSSSSSTQNHHRH